MTSRFLILAAAGAIALAGCGDSGADASEGGEAEAVGNELGGSVAPLAVCSDWQGASEAERLATVEDIRSQVNREDAGVTASELSDKETMEVFDNGCDKPYAQSFRLHVIYARAAAFKPLHDIAQGEVEPPTD